METFGKIIFGMLLFLIMAVFIAFVICQLWGWFVVPVFGLPMLTKVQAYGLLILANLVRYRDNSSKDDDSGYGDILKSYIRKLVFMLLYWGTGYIVSLLM